VNVHISSGHPSPTDGAVGVDPVKLYAVFRQSALYSRLARALQSEHPCEDNACDIGAAIEHETPLWGAHILSGATETSQEFDKEYLDAIHTLGNMGIYREALDIEREELLKVPHRNCPKCRSLVFDAEDFRQPVTCSNCLRELAINKHNKINWRVWRERKKR